MEDELIATPEEIEAELTEEDSPFKRTVKKIALGVIGLFLAMLIFTYLIPGTYVMSVLEGMFVSAKLQNFTVPVQEGHVIFEGAVYKELKEIYLAEQRNEFKVCLGGYKEGDDYYVNSLYKPIIHSQSFSHVSAEQCPAETIIPLHSHPYKSCIFSAQDIQSYEHFQSINPEAILGLICEVDRFSFYP